MIVLLQMMMLIVILVSVAETSQVLRGAATPIVPKAFVEIIQKQPHPVVLQGEVRKLWKKWYSYRTSYGGMCVITFSQTPMQFSANVETIAIWNTNDKSAA